MGQKPNLKITYTKITAVAEWKWDLPKEADDTCGICRVQFEGTCAKCKYPGDECPIIIGACTHCFHMHCIRDWLDSDASQGKCPMCRQPFTERVAEAGGAGTTRTPSTRQQRDQMLQTPATTTPAAQRTPGTALT